MTNFRLSPLLRGLPSFAPSSFSSWGKFPENTVLELFRFMEAVWNSAIEAWEQVGSEEDRHYWGRPIYLIENQELSLLPLFLCPSINFKSGAKPPSPLLKSVTQSHPSPVIDLIEQS